MMPSGVLLWQTVNWHYRKWISDGTLDLIHKEFMRKARAKAGRSETYTAGVIDSQSVKPTPCG